LETTPDDRVFPSTVNVASFSSMDVTVVRYGVPERNVWNSAVFPAPQTPSRSTELDEAEPPRRPPPNTTRTSRSNRA
jgi:hypothetical protein